MAYTTEKPTVEPGHRGDDEVLKHPSFGVISVARPQTGRGINLFDSAVKHNDFVAITIKTAQLDRGLNRNWVHAGKTILEFNMSEAQWAHFVSSSGMGGGTPITFSVKPAQPYQLENVPGIAPIDTMKQTFDREMKETARKYVAEIADLKAQVEALAANGKANKTQLSEIAHQLGIFLTNLPSNVAFTQKQFAEAMEKTTEAAKTDIEAFVLNMALSTGIDVMRERTLQLAGEPDHNPLPLIENDSAT